MSNSCWFLEQLLVACCMSPVYYAKDSFTKFILNYFVIQSSFLLFQPMKMI
jgi:hypothetical protein